MSRDRQVDPSAITRTALMTIEGERDDISGIGQTVAAHALCSRLPDTMKRHYEQKAVGHYGLCNGAGSARRLCRGSESSSEANEALPKSSQGVWGGRLRLPQSCLPGYLT
jgi:poly(3-hydroxybutyrate) depolymerase